MSALAEMLVTPSSVDRPRDTRSGLSHVDQEGYRSQTLYKAMSLLADNRIARPTRRIETTVCRAMNDSCTAATTKIVYGGASSWEDDSMSPARYVAVLVALTSSSRCSSIDRAITTSPTDCSIAR